MELSLQDEGSMEGVSSGSVQHGLLVELKQATPPFQNERLDVKAFCELPNIRTSGHLAIQVPSSSH